MERSCWQSRTDALIVDSNLTREKNSTDLVVARNAEIPTCSRLYIG
jgi:hypothetical protein